MNQTESVRLLHPDGSGFAMTGFSQPRWGYEVALFPGSENRQLHFQIDKSISSCYIVHCCAPLQFGQFFIEAVNRPFSGENLQIKSK